jgi:hypothetical protein
VAQNNQRRYKDLSLLTADIHITIKSYGEWLFLYFFRIRRLIFSQFYSLSLFCWYNNEIKSSTTKNLLTKVFMYLYTYIHITLSRYTFLLYSDVYFSSSSIYLLCLFINRYTVEYVNCTVSLLCLINTKHNALIVFRMDAITKCKLGKKLCTKY